jgi:hypothetical protein
MSGFSFYDYLLIHVLIGLCFLLYMIRGSIRNPVDSMELQNDLGRIVLLAIMAWPYSLLCRILASNIWLTPVSDLLLRTYIFRQEWSSFYLFMFTVMLFLNLMLVWYFKFN